MPKETDELLTELKTAESLDHYLHAHRDQWINGTLAARLETLLRQKGLTKSAVLQRAEINDIYGYQLFAGTRRPSRDKLIALCVGLSLTVDETQQLLKATGFAPLYAKHKRDSILIYGIGAGQSVFELNSALYDHGEPTL